jgi:CheY-like chemotaxis protein
VTQIGAEQARIVKRVAILVVEDEALIRLNAVDFLTDEGYVVLQAANADEAIRILETREDVALVFTDVNMPGSMDGLKLVELIHRRWPPVSLIVTSGKNALRDSDLPDSGRFVPKPYTNERILQVVQQLAA